MNELSGNELQVTGTKSRFIYKRALTTFGRLLGACRKRKHLTLTTLSQRSGISVKRLTKIENGTSPPHWPEATVLAGALKVRVSSMIKAVDRSVGSLSDDEYQGLMTYVDSVVDNVREDIQRDSHSNELVHHLEQTGVDETYCDATVAQWPAFFPPSLQDDLLAEAAALVQVMNILDGMATHEHTYTSPEIGNIPPSERSRWIMVPPGQLIAISQFQLLGSQARLQWIAQRHAKHAPPTYLRHIDNQCNRLALAISLLAPHRGRVKVSDIDLNHVDDSEDLGFRTLEDELAENPLLSEELPETTQDKTKNDNHKEQTGTFVFDLTTAVHHIAHVGQMLTVMIRELEGR